MVRDRTERFIDFQEFWDWFNDPTIWDSSYDTWRISTITITDRYIEFYIFDDFGNFEEKLLYRQRTT